MDDIVAIIERSQEYLEKLPVVVPLAPLPDGIAIAGWIDHTLLKPEATAIQVKTMCQEAIEHRFAAVCVNPVFASLVSGLLKDTKIATCCVVGFPLGANAASMKMAEAISCIAAGATEIDMVMNIGALKGEAYGQVVNDIQCVVEVAHHQGALVKVILEMALLTRKEKILACLLAAMAGTDFVKTSTGFGPGGATVEDVELMYRVVGPEVKVKAAGGIRTYTDALAMIRAGASRIGASAGIQILQEAVKS